MIEKLEESNFRNISHIVLNFQNKTSILTGANGIGKSNALNGLSFILTNVLLTDKWGAGENELNSVIPKNYITGQNPSITITLSGGTTFTKKYVPSKNGNNAEFYINGVKEKSKKNFEEKLYESLGFEKKLKCEREVNELRLYTDPLYALQKLEPKALRTLLVELGCSVTNEEVFELHKEFLPLKEFEAKFMGDYTKMRTSWKADRLELNKQLDSIPFLLDSYAGVEFKPEIREGLEKEKQEIITKIENLKNNKTSLVEGYKSELQTLNYKKKLFATEEQSKINSKLAVLEADLERTKTEAYGAQNEELKAINAKIQTKSEELRSLNESKRSYSITRQNCRSEAERAKITVDEAIIRRQQLEEQLEEEKNRQFIGFVTCPKCGHHFVGDEGAKALFEQQKQDNIANIELTLANLKINVEQKKKAFNEAYDKGYQAKLEEEKYEKRIHYLTDEIDTLNVQLANIREKGVDTSKIEEIEAQIKELKNTQIDTTEYDTKIKNLEDKINKILDDSAAANQEEISKLSSLKEDIEVKIKEQYEIESKEKAKNELIKKQEKIIEDLNNLEYLIELVNGFIQTKIKYINNKAKKLTGIDFVMLEENLTNEGIKEVCYATVDGVEFGNVNTSQKLEVGIKFIEKIKQILGGNDLPILADRLEGFDDIEKIKGLTTEQLICTVVGNKNQKEIIVI